MFRGIRLRKQKNDLNRKKKAALEEVSDAQLKACRQAFEYFDKDGEGTISKKELQDALGALGIIATRDDIDRIFIDTTQNEDAESLVFEEFVTVWSESLKTQKTQEDILQRAFQYFDRDGNGKLDKSEFMEVLTKLGDPLSEEQVNTFFDAVDDNRDGSRFLNVPFLACASARLRSCWFPCPMP